MLFTKGGKIYVGVINLTWSSKKLNQISNPKCFKPEENKPLDSFFRGWGYIENTNWDFPPLDGNIQKETETEIDIYCGKWLNEV